MITSLINKNKVIFKITGYNEKINSEINTLYYNYLK